MSIKKDRNAPWNPVQNHIYLVVHIWGHQQQTRPCYHTKLDERTCRLVSEVNISIRTWSGRYVSHKTVKPYHIAIWPAQQKSALQDEMPGRKAVVKNKIQVEAHLRCPRHCFRALREKDLRSDDIENETCQPECKMVHLAGGAWTPLLQSAVGCMVILGRAVCTPATGRLDSVKHRQAREGGLAGSFPLNTTSQSTLA